MQLIIADFAGRFGESITEIVPCHSATAWVTVIDSLNAQGDYALEKFYCRGLISVDVDGALCCGDLREFLGNECCGLWPGSRRTSAARRACNAAACGSSYLAKVEAMSDGEALPCFDISVGSP